MGYNTIWTPHHRHHILRCMNAATQLPIPSLFTISDLHTTTPGELQHERVNEKRGERRDGAVERTVADLSAELRHSRRKRPLSFDWELNHVWGSYPQMTQLTEGRVRVSWVMSCRLRPR